MGASKAQLRATKKYEKKNYDKILLRVKKGGKEQLKNIADRMGISVNQLVVDSINKANTDLNL